MHATEIYLPNDHILCLPVGNAQLGGICAFTHGSNVSAAGVTGDVVMQRLEELSRHGCRVCGSVPLSGDNNPRSQGILTVNYVDGVVCKGLCHYSALLQSAAKDSWLQAASDLLLES